jgi:hypothetical protein
MRHIGYNRKHEPQKSQKDTKHRRTQKKIPDGILRIKTKKIIKYNLSIVNYWY